jgi:hypothetical protein
MASVGPPLAPASIVGTALSGAATSGAASQPTGGHEQNSHSFEGPASPVRPVRPPAAPPAAAPPAPEALLTTPSPALQRAARSQISTAVSFEGGRAAGSVALPSRSLDGESALSAAEGDGERLPPGRPARGAR